MMGVVTVAGTLPMYLNEQASKKEDSQPEIY
jgi:hypothetical protein